MYINYDILISMLETSITIVVVMLIYSVFMRLFRTYSRRKDLEFTSHEVDRILNSCQEEMNRLLSQNVINQMDHTKTTADFPQNNVIDSEKHEKNLDECLYYNDLKIVLGAFNKIAYGVNKRVFSEEYVITTIGSEIRLLYKTNRKYITMMREEMRDDLLFFDVEMMVSKWEINSVSTRRNISERHRD